MNKSYSNLLKDCFSIEEINKIMEEKVFNKSKGSKFSDNFIVFPTHGDKYITMYYGCSGIFEVVLKLITYLKLDGKFENINNRSGIVNNFRNLRMIIHFLEKEYPNITNFSGISGKIIDKLIIENSQNQRKTVKDKINKLSEWINEANDYLPIFLQLNSNLIEESRLYKTLCREARVEVQNRKEISDKKVFPLFYLKTIVKEAIYFIENNSEDVFEIIKIFVKSKKMVNLKAINNHFVKLIAESKYEFKSEFGIKLKNSYIGIKKRRTFSRQSVYDFIDNLEASCVIIILLTTGMRSQELLKLNRYPYISNDTEYKLLKRIIFKTINNTEGKPLSVPIPDITVKALNILSEITSLKDEKTEGRIIINRISQESDYAPANIFRRLIQKFIRNLGMKQKLTPHQLRHAIAFLITYNNKEGIELAKEFLGHTSVLMTLQYLGQYSQFINDAIKEMQFNTSSELTELLLTELKKGKKLYGPKSKDFISNNVEFIGSYVDEFLDLLEESILGLIRKGQISIIQTPICFCIHDLSKSNKMECQRGLNLDTLINVGPNPSSCVGEICPNSIFTTEQVMKLENYDIDEDLKARLLQNSFVAKSDLLDRNIYSRILKQYKNEEVS